MLWKCSTQYAKKFGKCSSSHRTGKGQFSFQFQRKAMPKNAQTTTHLYSSHTLVAAAAAAKPPQSCPTLCDPREGSPLGSSPLGSSVPGILQARTLEWVAIVRWVQLCGSLNILWHCLSLGLEWKFTFSSPMAAAEFFKFAGILSAALSQHHLLGF